jgi:hypothetical protein
VGCIGLFTGALISLIGAEIIFFAGTGVPGDGIITLIIGGFSVALGLIFFTRGTRSKIIRFALNALYPVGAFLIIASIDQRVQNLGVSLFVLIIILFWVFTRVILSRLDHSRICGSCEWECARIGA